MASYTSCSCEGRMLKKANMTIASLKEDIRRLSVQLAQKDAALSSYGTLIRNQSKRLTSNMSFQDATPGIRAASPAPACSTPKQDVRWTEVVIHGRRGVPRKPSPPSPPPPLNLSNRYSALADGNPTTPANTVSSAPQRHSPSPPKHAVPRRITREKPRHPPTFARPATLVIGSSMVRHITLPSAETFCFPGARVADITAAIPSVLEERPTASTLVVHVGSNDIRLRQSEKLKSDFKSLTQSIFDSGKTCIISGPIPSVCFTDMQFSRVHQLHVWLKGFCSRANIPFADNFSSFWRRRSLFARDGRHLSRAGASLLASNLELAHEAHRSKD